MSGLLVSAIVRAEPIPLEDFVKEPEFDALRFSPDGRHFAAIVANKRGQLALTVVDFATNKGKSYALDSDRDIDSFRWLTNDLITFYGVRNGVRAFDLGMRDFPAGYVSIEGRSGLAWNFFTRAIRRVPGSETEVITFERNGYEGYDLYVVDSTNGSRKRTIVDTAPGPRIRSWVLDANLVPRAGVGYNATTHEREVWVRDAPDAQWIKAIAFNPRFQRGFVPVTLDANGDLLVRSNLATGRDALYKLDRSTHRPGELLVGHADFDVDGGLRFQDGTQKLVGIDIEDETERTYWFDDELAARQRIVDASLPGRVNSLTNLKNGNVLVHSRSDVDPGSYYFYDPKGKTLTEWLHTRPWIRPAQMSKMEVLRYKARDGQELFGYFTRPVSAPAGPVPLVVWVHGGPSARDSWGFDADVQFLASRGYAVFQPQFRGSTGMGVAYEQAGFRQWGRLMQDDVTDGVRKLIEQGRVDERRVCIGGASYGGYAALMGVIREPALYRCAIDEAGVTDLIEAVDSPVPDYNRITHTSFDAEAERDLYRRIGDTRDPQQRREMEANSPARLANKIKAPVLLLYGTQDWRVPLDQGTAMRAALKAAGARYEWKSYDGEGHALWDRDNRVDRLRRIEKFLAENLGSTASTAP